MKKVFCVFLAVILCFGTLSACSKPNTQTNTTTAAATTADITSEPLTEATTTAFKKLTDAQIAKLSLSKFKDYLNSIDYSGVDDDEIFSQKAQLTAKQFLNYLMSKDVKSISTLIGADYYNAKGMLVSNEAYAFFGKIDVDSYEISDITTTDSELSCNVKLSISKSGSELFPVGTSTWRLDVGIFIGDLIITYFRKADAAISKITAAEEEGGVFRFIGRYLGTFNYFETVTDFNSLVPDVSDKNSYDIFCYRVISFSNSLDGSIKRKQLESQAKKVLGITTVDFTKYSGYNKKDDSISLDGTEYPGFYCSLVSEDFNSATMIYTIVIDYYSDPAYILKAKTIKYAIRENNDRSFTLISTKLLFNTGAEPASFSY